MPILEAPIVAVTVFVNRARVIRRGTISLEAGEHILILDTLTEALEQDSVRASGRGSGVTLLGVDVKTDFVTEAPQENIAQLESDLETLQRTLQAWVDDANTITSRLYVIESFGKNSSRKLAQTFVTGGTSLSTVTELNTYIVEQMRELYNARRHNTQQQAELKKSIEATQAYLRQVRSPSAYKKRQIHVAVRAEAATEFELEAAYAVGGALWESLYDVRLRDDGEVELIYLANVVQRTGEDWSNVELTLSTARPTISTRLPELDPWYLSVQPTYRGGDMMMGAARKQRAEAEPVMRQSAPVPPAKPVAAVAQSIVAPSSSGASVTYKVGTPVTIPADGTPHKTTVAITQLSAKLDYVTAPKISFEAYLRATITNTSDYTLLPGDVAIFHEDEFVGKTRLTLTAANEEFKIQLGVDDRIKVERELLNREVSKRFIGITRRVAFVYHITITNFLPKSTKITVLDQIPIAHEENVKVQRESIQPEPNTSTDLGVLSWTFELAANAKQLITLSFNVEYNRDTTVRGLED